MEEEAIGRLFSGIERVLPRALAELRPHFERIETDWRRLLAVLRPSTAHLRMLAGLNLAAHLNTLCYGDLAGYHQALCEAIRPLVEGGVGEQVAQASPAFYLAACLPYLGSHDADAKTPVRANGRPPAPLLVQSLARAVSIAQTCIINSYAERRGEEQRDLERKLQAAEQRLRNFSIHLINISEQDRSRLSRDLHDEIGHNLLVLKLYMEMIAMDLKDGNTPQVAQKLDEAVDLVGQAIEGVRRLAFNLGPAILDEMGFVPSLQRYSRQFTARTGIQVRVDVSRFPAELPSSYQVALYRVFQGALSNVAAHARARNVRISLGHRKDDLFMAIEDDGIGFDIQKKLREPGQAFGLMAMRQRIELLGGSIRAESRIARSGKVRSGTRIEVTLPLMESEQYGQRENPAVNL